MFWKRTPFSINLHLHCILTKPQTFIRSTCVNLLKFRAVHSGVEPLRVLTTHSCALHFIPLSKFMCMSEQVGKCGSPRCGKKRRLIYCVSPQTLHRESSCLNVLEFKTGVVVHANLEELDRLPSFLKSVASHYHSKV